MQKENSKENNTKTEKRGKEKELKKEINQIKSLKIYGSNAAGIKCKLKSFDYMLVRLNASRTETTVKE